MPDIFSFTNYRDYLSALYAEKKAVNPHFSHRYIASKCALKSSGHFAQIIKGSVNISESLINRFARFLKLSRRETDYFHQMVLFTQAKTHEDKKRYYENMLRINNSDTAVLKNEQYEFYSKWYYTAVLEIIGAKGLSEDYKKLGSSVVPSITAAQAREAVKLLKKLDLIQYNDKGELVKKSPSISSGYDARSVTLNNFQIEMMQRAQESLDRFVRDERNLSTVSVGLSHNEYYQIIDELRKFRRKILDIASGNEPAERIYQFNFQIFPLSRSFDQSNEN